LEPIRTILERPNTGMTARGLKNTAQGFSSPLVLPKRNDSTTETGHCAANEVDVPVLTTTILLGAFVGARNPIACRRLSDAQNDALSFQ
jgi:hypothetical protein